MLKKSCATFVQVRAILLPRHPVYQPLRLCRDYIYPSLNGMKISFSHLFTLLPTIKMSFRPPRSLPILTLFHNVKSERSKAALALLQSKQKNASGEEKYRIDVIDENQQTPTDTQLKQVASFLKSPTPWKEMMLNDQITNAHDAFKALKEKPDLLNCPILVDWEKGKAVMGSPTLEAVEKLIQERNK